MERRVCAGDRRNSFTSIARNVSNKILLILSPDINFVKLALKLRAIAGEVEAVVDKGHRPEWAAAFERGELLK